MQYAWLEQLVKEGQVRPEIADEIYRDCSYFMQKSAEYVNINPDQLAALVKGISQATGGAVKRAPATAWEKIVTRLAPVQQAVGLAFGIGMPIALGAFAVGKIPSVVIGRESKKLQEIKLKLLSDPELGKHREKAEARYHELVRLSPHAALQEGVAKKLITERLHSGFTAQDAQNLALIQSSSKDYHPDMIPNISSHLEAMSVKKASENMIPVSGKVMGEICADVYTLIKSAASARKPVKYWQAIKAILPAMGIVAGAHLLTAAAVGGVHVVADAIKNRKMQDQLQKSFTDAMKQSDPNREPLHANKEKAQRAFQTLVHFSPHVASDPSAARAFMNSIVSQDLGAQIGSVKELSEIERNLKQVKSPHPFIEGLREGATLTGMGKAIGGTSKDLMGPIIGAGETDLADAMHMYADKPKYRNL